MSEIKLGALYDPWLLPDYRGPLYNHMSAKLVQRNIVDLATGSLVAPWDEYDKLCTGTVIIMKVLLHTYTMSLNGNTKKAGALLLVSKLTLFRSIKFTLTVSRSSCHLMKLLILVMRDLWATILSMKTMAQTAKMNGSSASTPSWSPLIALPLHPYVVPSTIVSFRAF